MKYADRFRDWLLRPITDRLDETKRAAEARAIEVERGDWYRRNLARTGHHHHHPVNGVHSGHSWGATRSLAPGWNDSPHMSGYGPDHPHTATF